MHINVSVESAAVIFGAEMFVRKDEPYPSCTTRVSQIKIWHF